MSEANAEMPKQIPLEPPKPIERTISSLHPEDQKRWGQILREQTQPTEKTEAEKKHEAAIMNSFMTLEISAPNDKTVQASGGLFEQYGKYYFVTTSHEFTLQPLNGDDVVGVNFAGALHASKIKDWHNTIPHPNDKTEHGMYYLEIKNEAWLNLINKKIEEKTLIPLAFTPERPTVNETVAVPRPEQLPEHKVQYATVTTDSNLVTNTDSNKTQLDGEYTFTLETNKGKIMICSGMSGTPILKLKNGQVTNYVYGLASSIFHDEGPDIFGYYFGENSYCDRVLNVRPNEGAFLMDQNEKQLGYEKPIIPSSQEKSQVTVTRIDSPNPYVRDQFTGKRTSIPQKNTSK